MISAETPLIALDRLARKRPAGSNDEFISLDNTREINSCRDVLKYFTQQKGFHTVAGCPALIVPRTPVDHGSIHSYAGYSFPGFNKGSGVQTNQDAMILAEDPITKSLLVVCLDGHGANGDRVAQYVRDRIEQQLFKHELFQSDTKKAIMQVVLNLEQELFNEPERFSDLSGTTMSLAVIRDKKVTIANVGDSRIVLAKRPSYGTTYFKVDSDSESSTRTTSIDSIDSLSSRESTTPNKKVKTMLVGQSLTIDHKPDQAEEYKRIVDNGGRVFSVRYKDGNVGPPRVWLSNKNLPGLAMSRSIGDFIVQTVGVISTPEFFEVDLNLDDDYMMIAATDGLWDYVSNNEAVNLAACCSSPDVVVAELIEESRKRWLAKDGMADDTTVCVTFFNSLNSSLSRMAPQKK